MKRDLFVFAGQSNMMGASVFAPREDISLQNSFEYKHKARRLGASRGEFSSSAYPAGEFSYADMALAYRPDCVTQNGESCLTDYINNTYFCPAMSNLKSKEEKSISPFFSYSEATAQIGVTLAPLLAKAWEDLGRTSAYAHIAKGGVALSYYMTNAMAAEYAARMKACNRENKTKYTEEIPAQERMEGAAEYFFEKCRDFFEDAEALFPEELSGNKCFFWLQGESDAGAPPQEYEMKLDILWEALKKIGFSHFFCIRVDYFGAEKIFRIMQAQESFVSRHADAYMLTRAASFFPYVGQDEAAWFSAPPTEEYRYCRDSFFGYANQHINEKGFMLLAKRGAENLFRVLIKNEAPLLEEENVRFLLNNASIE